MAAMAAGRQAQPDGTLHLHELETLAERFAARGIWSAWPGEATRLPERADAVERLSRNCLFGRASVRASPNISGRQGSRGRSPSRVREWVHSCRWRARGGG